MNPENFYRKRIDQFSLSEKKINSSINLLSLFRIISFVLTVFFFIRGVKLESLPYFILTGFLLILFFILLVQYKKKSNEKKKIQVLIQINQREVKALKGNFREFNDGSRFLDPEHEFTYDLDVFGPASLYQYICRCCTERGHWKLSSRFLKAPHDPEQINRNKNIHMELGNDPEFMQDYLASGKIIDEKEDDMRGLENWLTREGTGIRKGIHIFALILSVLNVGLIILSVFFGAFFGYLVISVLLSWLLYGFFFSKINRYHSDTGNKQELIKKYNALSRVLSRTNFKNDFLQKGKAIAENSLNQFRKLENLMDLFDSRLNLLVGAVFNTIFLLDFHLIQRLEKWKIRNKFLFKEVLNIHSEIDAYISGGIFQFNHPSYENAHIKPGKFIIEKMGHPLIQPGTCVRNDFQIHSGEKIIIVTGANMAGKSTFLRTLGINFILAGAGFPVYAEKFHFSPIPVITGMRTTDSLSESESYFFAELKRMKKIMDRLRNGDHLLVLLDEILKGTNSLDKHKGSEELLKQMLEYNCISFIATHDLELSKLEGKFPENIKNYYFESRIEADELKFDYKIKEGKADTMNASFLLRKMGVLK